MDFIGFAFELLARGLGSVYDVQRETFASV